MTEATGTGYGRVNLIGEHTDYNQGFALPLTLPVRTIVRASIRSDWRVAARSDAFPEDGQVIVESGAWERTGNWTDYVTGASALLAREGIFEHGASLVIGSNVPTGAGLASSAALCVAVVRALSRLGGMTLDDLEIARLAHVVETEFVGAPVGFMDQIAAVGEPGSAQLIDFQAQSIQRIPIPGGVGFEVIDSGLRDENRSGGYARRREECAEAANILNVTSLRDAQGNLQAVERLPEPLNRRVRHVFTENDRVLMAVEALQHEDYGAFGQVMMESHRSLRDDFEVSLPAIDAIVERAVGEGALGARLTGGGFGGSVVVAKRR